MQIWRKCRCLLCGCDEFNERKTKYGGVLDCMKCSFPLCDEKVIRNMSIEEREKGFLVMDIFQGKEEK